MIQKGTMLNVIDNSGAKKSCCIQVLKGYRKRYANIKYYTVCLLFYLKCILGLTKNLLFFNKNKIQNWYYNIITF